MDPEKQLKLKELFPLTYRSLKAPSSLFPPSPISERGIECGNGWYQILHDLSETIEKTLEKLEPASLPTYVSQVKEKFGGLQVYLESSQGSIDELDELEEAIAKTNTLSYKTCEVCGDPGKLRKGSWLMTLCEEHSGGKAVATAIVGEGYYDD